MLTPERTRGFLLRAAVPHRVQDVPLLDFGERFSEMDAQRHADPFASLRQSLRGQRAEAVTLKQ